MSQLFLDQLSPILISQLEILARLHGHSSQEEIEAILQQAVKNQLRSRSSGSTMEQARAAVERAQIRYAEYQFSDSAELIREDRER